MHARTQPVSRPLESNRHIDGRHTVNDNGVLVISDTVPHLAHCAFSSISPFLLSILNNTASVGTFLIFFDFFFLGGGGGGGVQLVGGLYLL